MNELLKTIQANGGFMTEDQLKVIVKEDRMRMVLVRCGMGRFMAHAQDVQHFIDIIERDGKDYIRDISLPAADPINL